MAAVEPLDGTEVTFRQRDIVFTFTFETWSDAVEREFHRPPDRLLEALLRNPYVGGLLVANPFRSLPIRFARRLGGASDAPFPSASNRDVLTPYRLRRHDPGTARALERHYRAYDRQLRRAADDLGLREPVVITNNPVVAGFAPLAWAGPVTYYARDDLSVHPGYRHWWPAVELAYERLRQRGVRVCAVSQTLLDRIAPTGPSAVVPNGVDADEFLLDHPLPGWMVALAGRPTAVYAGTIDDRIDVGLVGACASALPEITFLFVGQIDDPMHLAPLSAHRNVVVRSAVPRAELVAALRAASCCIVPHRRTRLTEAMSPLKLYEYLAAGARVAAVDLPPMRGVSDDVFLTTSRQAFVEAVRAAVEAGPIPEGRRRAFIAANDWTGRHKHLLEVAFR